jgi:hypothetical protein
LNELLPLLDCSLHIPLNFRFVKARYKGCEKRIKEVRECESLVTIHGRTEGEGVENAVDDEDGNGGSIN